MDFNKKYFVGAVRAKLENIAKNEKWLRDEWILGKKRNIRYKGNGKYIKEGDLEYYALIDWTLPSITYEYHHIDLNEFLQHKKNDYKIARSSFIPVVRIDEINNWLLGSFRDYEKSDNPILADFGGSCENRDMEYVYPALECALREAKEESDGLLDSHINKAFKNDNIVIFEGRNDYHRKKLFFIFIRLEYEDVKDIPHLFSRKKGKNGALAFYKQSDVKSFKYRTSKNLTDFLYFLNKL